MREQHSTVDYLVCCAVSLNIALRGLSSSITTVVLSSRRVLNTMYIVLGLHLIRCGSLMFILPRDSDVGT